MGAKLDKDLKDKETGDPLPYSTEAEEGNSLSKAFTPDCTNRTGSQEFPLAMTDLTYFFSKASDVVDFTGTAAL